MDRDTRLDDPQSLLWDEAIAAQDRLYDVGYDADFTDEERSQPNYVAARPHLPDVGMFDAEFFGMFPREAAVTDPQHRVFLEICWEALESGGYDAQRYNGMIGVFAGCSMPTYLINNVLRDRAKAEESIGQAAAHDLAGGDYDDESRSLYELDPENSSPLPALA